MKYKILSLVAMIISIIALTLSVAVLIFSLKNGLNNTGAYVFQAVGVLLIALLSIVNYLSIIKQVSAEQNQTENIED